MSDEIQLISDGDGLAVIGEPAAVERFLTSHSLPSKELKLDRLRPAAKTAGTAMKAASEISSHSGRWVQMTKESVDKINAAGGLMRGHADGLSRGVIRGSDGRITGLVEFAQGPGAMLTNPAILAGVGGVMAQYAMQQAMDEIADYLKVIDAKVDDILRAQKDAVLADMVGVELMIDETMAIRNEVGRVNEVMWGKVQGAGSTIASTQAYALRQLDALADKLERKPHVDDVAPVAKEAEATVQEWLAVLARCFQLQDAIAVLELDRVMDAASEDLHQHRAGLRIARENRRALIARSTSQLLARMDAAAEQANTKVFLNPINAPRVVRAGNHVAGAVGEFQQRLGIEQTRQSVEAKRWIVAAGDAKDKAVEIGGDAKVKAVELGAEVRNKAQDVAGKGVDAAKARGTDALDRAKAARGRLAERLSRRKGADDDQA